MGSSPIGSSTSTSEGGEILAQPREGRYAFQQRTETEQWLRKRSSARSPT